MSAWTWLLHVPEVTRLAKTQTGHMSVAAKKATDRTVMSAQVRLPTGR